MGVVSSWRVTRIPGGAAVAGRGAGRAEDGRPLRVVVVPTAAARGRPDRLARTASRRSRGSLRRTAWTSSRLPFGREPRDRRRRRPSPSSRPPTSSISRAATRTSSRRSCRARRRGPPSRTRASAAPSWRGRVPGRWRSDRGPGRPAAGWRARCRPGPRRRAARAGSDLVVDDRAVRRLGARRPRCARSRRADRRDRGARRPGQPRSRGRSSGRARSAGCPSGPRRRHGRRSLGRRFSTPDIAL